MASPDAQERVRALTLPLPRSGLSRLVVDVVAGDAQFEVVLVYDVSRWGRFQEADESAHYEFLCKRAGIRVVYCAEQFGADGTPLASVLKP